MVVPTYDSTGRRLVMRMLNPTVVKEEPAMINGVLCFVFSTSAETEMVRIKAAAQEPREVELGQRCSPTRK